MQLPVDDVTTAHWLDLALMGQISNWLCRSQLNAQLLKLPIAQVF